MGNDSPRQGRRAARGTVFVGHAAQISALREALAAAAAGRGRVLVLSGEAGVGKTRLAEELANHAEQSGTQVLWGGGQGRATRSRFGSWVHLLAACTAASGAPGSAAGAADPVDGDAQALVDTVIDSLRRRAVDRPLLAILDDLHDAVSLQLLGPVAHAVHDLPVLLLATLRGGRAAAAQSLAQALGDGAPAVDHLRLDGLDDGEVSAFLGAHLGATPPAEVTAALQRHADGRPALLSEFMRAVLSQQRLASGDDIAWESALPRALRAVVRQRVTQLSRSCQTLLAAAAVAGYEFDADSLPAVPRATEPHATLLHEAIDANLLAPIGGRRCAFVHGLVRDTLYDELPTARRARLHRQVAAALRCRSASDEVLAALAHHHYAAALLAGATTDAERAADYAEEAARRAIARQADGDAAHFYRLALNALGSAGGRRRAQVWFELGEVLHRCGDGSAARAAFGEAVALARRLGCAEILARAALGMSGRYMEVGATDESLCALLAEALVRLPAADSPLRARVLARLAVELAYTRQPERAAELSADAAAMAEHSGDSAALAYAFGAAYLTALALDDPAQRLAHADQVLARVEAAGDLEGSAEICGWRVDCLVELGDRDAIDAAVARHAGVAAELGRPAHDWLAAMFRTMTAILDGDLAAAENLAGEAVALGEQAQDPNAAHAFAAQIFSIRSELNRLEELRDGLAASVEQYPAMPGWAAALALLHARAGRWSEASALLDRVAPRNFAALPRDRVWLATVAMLAETSAALPDAPHAAELYALLLPYGERNVTFPGGSVSPGAAARFLGLLATALGRYPDAERHFAAALALHARLRAPLLLAHSQCDRAAMLVRRDGSGDRDAAAELLRAAAATAAAFAAPHLAARAATLRASLAAAADAHPGPPRQPSDVAVTD